MSHSTSCIQLDMGSVSVRPVGIKTTARPKFSQAAAEVVPLKVSVLLNAVTATGL